MKGKYDCSLSLFMMAERASCGPVGWLLYLWADFMQETQCEGSLCFSCRESWVRCQVQNLHTQLVYWSALIFEARSHKAGRMVTSGSLGCVMVSTLASNADVRLSPALGAIFAIVVSMILYKVCADGC